MKQQITTLLEIGREIGGRTAQAIWPRSCAACTNPIRWNQIICVSCEAGISFVDPGCTKCGTPYKSPVAGQHPCPQCLQNPPAFDRHRSLVLYEDPVRKILHRFKFGAETGLAKLFAEWIVKWNEEERKLLTCDYLIPVPLYHKRMRERLFNQSLVWARALGQHTEGKVLPHSLRKQKETASQTRLGQKEREKNLAEAFIWLGPDLKGKRVLLVDDVFTTGSTLRSCAATLRAHNPGTLTAVTIAFNPKKYS